MPKLQSYSIGPVREEARTKTEARTNAESAAASILDELGTPIHFAAGDYCILVYRSVYGWGSRILRDETGWRHTSSHNYTDDYQQACDSAIIQLAQLSWKPGYGLRAHRDLASRMNGNPDFRSWAKWQLRFRHARANGLNENACHDYAGWNPMGDSSGWAELEATIAPELRQDGDSTRYAAPVR